MLNRIRFHAADAVLAIVFSAAVNNRAQAAFADGDFVTHEQGIWGGAPSGTNPPALVMAHYATIYPTGTLQVGIPGAAGNSIRFSGPSEVLLYLPGIGPASTLLIDHVNPLVTEAGAYGGEAVALTLNIDFSAAGPTLGALGIPFGDLRLYNLTETPLLNGLTVREVLATVNTVLGGGIASYGVAELYPLANELNFSFGGGMVNQFAQEHLRVVVDMRGDFNQNGTVDAADYVVWRKTLGQIDTGNGLAGDGDGDGDVDANDYNLWRAAFGNTTASAAAQAVVPEPSTFGLALLALLGLASRRRWAAPTASPECLATALRAVLTPAHRHETTRPPTHTRKGHTHAHHSPHARRGTHADPPPARSGRANILRRGALAPLLLLALQAPASAALLQLHVTYTNGQIVSGPLSADLTELPESVEAFFTVSGSPAGVFSIADVVEASLAFGDVTCGTRATWRASARR